MMKRKRSCSALHLFVVFVAKSGANVSTGSSGMAAFCYYGEEISLAIFPEYQQKHLAKRLPCMAGMGAKKSTIPFCTLLSEQSGR